MTDIGIIKDTSVDDGAPGQVFVNAFGEGGQQDAVNGEGRELVTDREIWSDWFIVSRPPKSGTFATDDETECVIQRLGPDDNVVTNSKNRQVESEVRTAIATDLVPGDAVLFTGDGTNSVRIHLKPGGAIDIVTSGNVNIGGSAADSFVARYTELQTLYNSLKTAYDAHGHQYLPGPGAAVFSNGPGASIGASAPPVNAPSWDANIASDTLKSD